MEVPKNKQESIEYIPDMEVVCDFLNINEEQLDRLRERLEGVNGHARVWVHPLYTEQYPQSIGSLIEEGENIEDIQVKLRTAFLKTVDSVLRNPNSSPLFVYEGDSEIEKTKTIIAEHTGLPVEELEDNGIYIVPTENGSPEISSSALISSLEYGKVNDRFFLDNIIDSRDAEKRNKTFGKIHKKEIGELYPEVESDPFLAGLTESERHEYINLLSEHVFKESLVSEEDLYESVHKKKEDFLLFLYSQVGLKSSLVSGAYMTARRNYQTDEYILNACAGGVAQLMRDSEIQTDISENIWPPKDKLRKLDIELKETGKRDN